MVTSTPALEALDKLETQYEVVRTEPASSAEESAAFQGVAPGQLLKTIVVRKGESDYVFVLVPADRTIDWKKLRQRLRVSRAALPEREEAERVTGYKPGTITPFGSRGSFPVVIDHSARSLDLVALGGGAPGVNVHIRPGHLPELLDADFADVTKLSGG
ncbi:MAG: YbaK/EbsC family protein [Actinomycetota bacterium]|nr:YbaK/EbsC family protein [Actinomycetota bacterium]